MDRDRTRTLQVRVDTATGKRFSALAAVLGITESELLRRAVNEILTDAGKQIDALKETKIEHG